MADEFSAKFNALGLDAALANLTGSALESLARRMLVSGGVLLRDEAKRRAPVKTGRLKGAIYLAASKRLTRGTVYGYSISWNAKIFGFGHLIEFGHWRYNEIINGKAQKSLRAGLKKGTGPQDHIPPGALVERKWVMAKPFLGPTFDGHIGQAKDAMIQRGRIELPILIAEARGGS